MKIAIIPNYSKVHTPQVTDEVIQLLLSMDCQIYFDEHLKTFLTSPSKGKCHFLPYHEMLNECQAIIAIGGDGTVIHCAEDAGKYDKPILGINTGRLGYVTELEKNELELLRKLPNNDFTTEKRMMLRVEVERKGTVVFSCNALNDAVVNKGTLSKIIDFEVFASENNICRYRSDGGPIVDPTMEGILLVPMCPHALSVRPVIFDRNTVLHITAESVDNEIYLTVDGDKSVRIISGCQLTVQKSDVHITLIKLKNRDFYSVLNEKLCREMK